MEDLMFKLKSKKGICVLCCILLLTVILLFLVLKINFTKDTPEETTTQETTTEEPTTEEPTTEEPTTEEPTTEEPTTEPETVIRTETPDSSDIPYGRITCSAIGLSCDVYKGEGNRILRKGAAQIPATYMPGYGGLIMVGAHNNTYFNCLQYINIDDIITIQTDYGTYNYQVTYTEVVDVTGKNAYDFWTDHEQLLLYTCYPFDMLSETAYRFMVHADLVSGPSVIE